MNKASFAAQLAQSLARIQCRNAEDVTRLLRQCMQPDGTIDLADVEKAVGLPDNFFEAAPQGADGPQPTPFPVAYQEGPAYA